MVTEQRGALPDPGRAGDLAEFVGLLGELRAWAGMPSYRVLAKRVGSLMRPPRVLPTTTVADTFKAGRRRLDLDLVIAVVRALGVDEAEVGSWRQACIKVHSPARSDGPVGVFGQLPTDLATFTGRGAELDRLIRAATDRREGLAANTVVISSIEGMAGVGKTQLAVHAAHRLVRDGHFTDVQLHINLRGFDPDLPPADPSAVLEAFLRQLGVPAPQIPAGRSERAAMYRDRLRNRSALVLLDNAADEDQVRDLVPAGPDCLVLVTSRRSLAGLDGVTPHLIDTFSDAESVELLVRIAGRDRVAADPEAAARIVRYCDRLPLALALAAARLRSRPAWSLTDLADRLEEGRLAAIRAGGRALRPVFDLSYRGLTEPLQRIFRLLGHHPGPDFTPAIVAALAGVPADEAEEALELLQDENLVRQGRPGRYELHDLLRAYAVDTAASSTAVEASAALDRLARWFLCSAHSAATAMNAPGLPEPAAAGDLAPLRFDSREAALAWFDTEHANLVATHRAAAEQDQYETTWKLPIVLDHFRNLRFHRTHSLEAHRVAVESARARDDRPVAAWNLMGAHASLHQLSRFEEAEAVISEALGIYRELHDSRGEGQALGDLGNLYNSTGRPAEAIAILTRSMALNEEHGDRRRVMICQVNLGVSYYLLGDLDSANTYFRHALTAARSCGERRGECVILNNLGEVHLRLDQAERAHDFYFQAQKISDESGDRDNYGTSLSGLGDTLDAMGRTAEAVSYWRTAHAVLSEIGSPKAAKVRELIRKSEADPNHRDPKHADRHNGDPKPAHRHNDAQGTGTTD
ncbi:ATP-binding protein [Kitasatospora sp. NPDC092948]|uniref:ATP-binding protein n=1 Tax=Kitasatospora sp. NPDC092948 TaxID=3364088 RepID=UPI0038146C0C